MEIEYTENDYKGNDSKESQSVASFLYDEILYAESRSGSREKIRLEDQPQKVVEALGRLVERLLDKDIINLEDLKYIADCGWGKKSDSLQLKKSE